jgi:hypothetical protein
MTLEKHLSVDPVRVQVISTGSPSDVVIMNRSVSNIKRSTKDQIPAGNTATFLAGQEKDLAQTIEGIHRWHQLLEKSP